MDEYKSREEEAFALWCAEAQTFGLVASWSYEPPEWELTIGVSLKKKVKGRLVKRSLLQGHVYTCDFEVKLTELGLKAFSDVFPKTYLGGSESHIFGNQKTVIIDIKGGFSSYDGSRSFSINQKLMWDKHKVFVEKVVHWKPQRDRKGNPKKTNKDGSIKTIKCFFMDTFCPKPLRTLQNGATSVMGQACPTVEEFMKPYIKEKWDGPDPF
jgi:hypothetical protein